MKKRTCEGCLHYLVCAMLEAVRRVNVEKRRGGPSAMFFAPSSVIADVCLQYCPSLKGEKDEQA